MAESAIFTRLLNPWVLHLQKMGLELKCPLCLDLLNRPLLLPCNHIFCSSCVETPSDFKLDCPVCKSPYVHQDLRPAPSQMENMVNIYKCMDAAFGATMFPSVSQADLTDSERPMSQSPISENTVDDKLQNFRTETRKHTETPPSSPYQRSEVENRSVEHSPPCFGETKDSDDDCFANGRQNSAKRLPTEGAVKKELDGTCRNMYDGPVPKVQKNCVREAKRKFDYEPNSVVTNGVNGQKAYSASGSMFMSKPHSPLCGAQQAKASVNVDTHPAPICAFCQSSKLSEGSGPIWHFANGKQVAEDDLPVPNVVHVHRKCLEWAPQAYFVGDTVKNLEAEIARGAKLKCSSCGLKGAALGCFVTSCRKSFHAPCAVKIAECRWDCEDFLMLCPTHTSKKFPLERSKRRKNIATDQSCTTEKDNQQSNAMNHGGITKIDNQKSKFWTASPAATNEWVLCGSALSFEEKNLLTKFARISGATVAKSWMPNVTHMIASTDEMGACSRTKKVLMAILNGKWVLKIDWIRACMEVKSPVGEEPYEVSLDLHGCQEGPKKGRLRVMDKAPKLFSGLNFYLNDEFVLSYECLEDLILAAGGLVLTKDILVSQTCDQATLGSTTIGGSVLTKDILVSQTCDQATLGSTTMIVCSADPPLESKSEKMPFLIEQSQVEANALGAQTGCKVIGHTWLLQSIAACELQPFDWPCMGDEYP